MTQYQKDIEQKARFPRDEVYYNSNEHHALIVLKNLVRNATAYIKTICGNMCSEVSQDPEYLRFLDDFLAKEGTRFDILFDDYSENVRSKDIFTILSKYPEKVRVRKLRDGFSNIMYESNPVHITVSDGKAFRIETDIVNKKAWGNFNNPTKAKVYAAVFDNFFKDEYSEEVALAVCNC